MKKKIFVLCTNIFVFVILTSCGSQYTIDESKNVVIRNTWNAGMGSQQMVVEGADAKTFKMIKIKDSNRFARDKNYVYYEGERILGADPNTFTAFGPNYRDEKCVFRFIDGKIKPLLGSNPEKFKVLDSSYSIDDKQVFYFNDGFSPRDIATFEVINDRAWSRDKDAYYWGALEVKGADRETFKILDPSLFAQDKNYLYWYGCVIKDCNVKKFVCTGHNTGHDDKFEFKFYSIYETKESNQQSIRIEKTLLPAKQ